MSGLLDALQEILYSLGNHKLRTFLTAFGVFWGIFMLILLLGAGKGLQNGIEADFSADARDSVWVRTRKTSVPYKGLGVGREINFTTADVNAVQAMPQVLVASSEQQAGAQVRHGQKSQNFQMIGVGDGYFNIKIGQELREGRKLNRLDANQVRKVASIGTSVAESLFGQEDPVGQPLYINEIAFTVVGVFHEGGNGGRMSERIYIPMSLYQKAFGQGKDYVRLITYQPAPGYDPWQTETDVINLLKARHSVAPEDRSAIRANNLLKQSQWVNALFSAINAFIWFVGVGTLMAGIVGISNIMMITVKERTVEIGVRKALGATPRSIIATLLLESILVTAIAGYLGLALAVGLLELVNNTLTKLNLELPFFTRPEVDFTVAVTSIILLVSAGALAGFAPAWRAARVAPVEAMRAT